MANQANGTWSESSESGLENLAGTEVKSTQEELEAAALRELDFAWMCLRRIFMGTAWLALIACVLVATLAARRVVRIESARYALARLNATYHWEHEPVSPRHRGQKATQQRLAKWLGNSTVSGLSDVQIDQPDAGDAKLGFLSSLLETQSLQLYSDAATDQTLAIVSQMPNLQYLKLFGSRFTVHGLLKLRQLPSLKQLTIDAMQLSPIEFAVLKAELPGVKLVASRQPPFESNYPAEAQPIVVL